MSRLTGLLIEDYIGVIVAHLTLAHAPVYDSAGQTKLVFVFKAPMFAQRLINIYSGIK